MSSLRDAQRALRKGAVDEALVYLWNELEPARVEADRRSLAAIGRMATEIAEHGDPAQQRDAARLLAEIAEATAPAPEPAALTVAHPPGPEPEQPASERHPGPTTTMPEPTGEPPPIEDVPHAEAEQERRGQRLASWIWAVIVLAVILLNILRNLLDRS